MPLNQRDYIQLMFLICCIPLQYYLSNYNSEELSYYETKYKLVENMNHPIDFMFDPLKKALGWFLADVINMGDAEDETPAIEVFEYRMNYVKKFRKVHSLRIDIVLYRVGQVVEHLYEGYKGVIIGWDYDDQDFNNVLYTILVEENVLERKEPRLVEVAQDTLYLMKHTMIDNRYLKDYFKAFDGSQYIPQPWLQHFYPKD